MKQKHVNAAREARLWVKDIVVPVIGAVFVLAAYLNERRQ